MKNTTFQKILADTVAKLRKDSGMSMEEMASHLGIPCSILSEMEAGETVIPVEKLIKTAKALGMKTGKIVDGAETIGEGLENQGFSVDWDTTQVKNPNAAFLGGLVVAAIALYFLSKK